MRLGIKRLGRVATLAAGIVAGSSLLDATGQPLLTALSQIAFNLAAGFSEAEGVRQRISEAPIMATNRRRKATRLTRFESFGPFDAPQESASHLAGTDEVIE
jgi:hypothetical protein